MRLCYSAEGGIVLNSFLNFEQREALCSYKIVFVNKGVFET